jgi:nucleoside-diphosphate-sugar epimerase
MRVFISGATGVLGRRVVRLLVGSGHQVVGLSRSQKGADWLNQQGAVARTGDLFNQEQICELSSDCNAILHLATAIPTRPRTTLDDWKTNDHIRRAGTQITLEAALRNRCELYLTHSVLLAYGDRNGEWVDENTPLSTQQASILQSAADLEHIVRKAINERDLPAIILRYGSFYCYDSAQTQAMFEMTRQGIYSMIGDGSMYWNNIHVDDGANAVLKAVENYTHGVGQTFNVCDDEPVRLRKLLNYVAEMLGAKKPGSIPASQAEAALGAHIVEFLLASVRCKNRLIKERLNWSPKYPTYRQGYRAAIEKWLSSEKESRPINRR